jgi:hypothetical protein
MTIGDVETSIQRVQRWAREEVDKIVYGGTRPVSVCSTVDAATREAAIARANSLAHAAEIAEIESIANHVSECLKANLDRSAWPAAPSPSVHDGALAVLTQLLRRVEPAAETIRA